MKRKCNVCKKTHKSERVKTEDRGTVDDWSGVRFMGIHAVCDTPECLSKYSLNKVRKEAEKARKAENAAYFKETKRLKKKYSDSTRPRLIDRVQWDYFNPWVKERDKDLPCISCGKFKGIYHAGHYKTIGARKDIRFHPDNCHKQCADCNLAMEQSKSLEATIAAKYRENLIKKIGVERVEALEVVKVHRYTVEELEKIKAEYSAKLKELRKKEL